MIISCAKYRCMELCFTWIHFSEKSANNAIRVVMISGDRDFFQKSIGYSTPAMRASGLLLKRINGIFRRAFGRDALDIIRRYADKSIVEPSMS